jgi:hypothetical protein
MKQTLMIKSEARLAVLSAVVGLLLLAACSYAPETTPAPASPTALPGEIVLPLIGGEDESPGSVVPSRTADATAPATARADSSPLPSPTALEPEPPHVDSAVTPGEPAPDFTLENVQGEAVSLSDYRGMANVVLVFYRGQT